MCNIKQVSVIGAGQMGQQIAMQCALSGHRTSLYDVNEQALQEAHDQLQSVLDDWILKGKITEGDAERAFENVNLSNNLADTVGEADLVIEAIVEDLTVKRELFLELEQYSPDRTIFATNSSTIVSSKLAEVTNRPEKILNMHFFNPPLVMELVEVVRHEKTSDETVETVVDFCQSINRTGVVIEKEIFGFIANRILMAITKEALHLYEGGYANYESIDFIVKKALGHPLGPFELMDLSGLDIAYAVSELHHKETGKEEDKPSKAIKNKLAKGHLGRKTGRGWYDYSKD